MRQTAQVTRVISPGRVEVKIRRQSACASAHNCGSCDACALLANAPEVLVVAEDGHGARVGDTVTVESETTRILGAAAVLYLAPFFLLFAFYLIGQALNWAEGPAVALGFGGFLLGLLAAFLLDRRMKARPVRYRIVAVVG